MMFVSDELIALKDDNTAATTSASVTD